MNGSAQESGPRVISSSFLDKDHPKKNLALIVLNWKLPKVTPLLLQEAAFCICADGGANRLHDEVPDMFLNEPADQVRARFLPHLIKGDLDSIRPDVLDFYQSRHVPIADLSADQMTTDLQKCITYIEHHLLIGGEAAKIAAKNEEERTDSAFNARRQIDTIVAVGAHGGRLDHILSNLSTLHTFRHMNIVLCGDGNLTRLIPEGTSIIKPMRSVEGPSCGLIPLIGPATATSRGLRWNLENMTMEIGGLVSTSNIMESDEIYVETDRELIWTTQLRDPSKMNQQEESSSHIDL